MRRGSSRLALLLAAVFLAFHLPYLPPSLEDLDSVNFALGVRHFDVAAHQPHPPGYPLFILAAKGAHALIPNESQAMAAVNATAGALGVLVLVGLYRRFAGGGNGRWPLVAALLASACPLYWFTAVRPLSDTTGLVAALAVQLLTLSAMSRPAEAGRHTSAGRDNEETLDAVGGDVVSGFSWMLLTAAFLAGLAAGIRSQVVWLTVPLLGYALLRHRSRAIVRTAALAVAAFGAGVLVWFVPLVALTGGPAGYWHALFNQGAEDLSGIQMLWTRPTLRELASALYYALVAPWARWDLAAVALALAALGLFRLWRAPRGRWSPALALTIAFAPYFVFDVLFQETFTSRYALPLVVPVAFLVAQGCAALGPRIGPVLAVVVVLAGGSVGTTSVAAYARQKAPVFRLLEDMRAAESGLDEMPVLAADRREDLDLRRPSIWLRETGPRFFMRLPAPAQHEWLETVKYWNGGGRRPVWFVADPRRAQIDLTAHGRPTTYRWSVPYPVLLGGVRPNEMDWYRLDRPEWYVGEGWALTPESAGVADLDHRGLASGPIEAWISRAVLGGTLVVGGRNFDAVTAGRVTVALDGQAVASLDAAPAMPFLELLRLPASTSGSGDYAKLTVAIAPPVRAAVEQFDASVARPVFGFGPGWQEQEYNGVTGLRWRWLSERGELRVSSPGPVVLHLEGESPKKYFSRGSRLIVRAGNRVAFDGVLAADFSLDVPIEAPTGTITLETDQVYTPADRSRRTQDRRHLGLRIFRCELRPAS